MISRRLFARFNSSFALKSLPEIYNRDTFQKRHLGPNLDEVKNQLELLGYENLDQFIDAVVPESILVKRPLKIEPQNGFTESEMLAHMKELAKQNVVMKNFIGKGYYGTIVPSVIQRNLFESPEWYTSYTPYQPEISQGRLESLLNYQTVVSDLTGLPVANASLLDEGTAAAEAMILSFNSHKKKRNVFVVDKNVHPQTIDVLKSRATTLSIELQVVDISSDLQTFNEVWSPISSSVAGVLLQYPGTNGELNVENVGKIIEIAHESGAIVAVASDLLALTLVKPPGELGADICLGNSQRFGVPLGFGGPHAAFFAVTEKFNRKIPGRIVGVSKDRLGRPALRLALQTREQHIKRERATSNICTAQALLANMASNYAVFHGPKGLKKIASRILALTNSLASNLTENGYEIVNKSWFDTLTITVSDSNEIVAKAAEKGLNVFQNGPTSVSISLDETATIEDVKVLSTVFGESEPKVAADEAKLPENIARTSSFLTNPVFNKHHTETAMMRYLHNLQQKDLSLADSMITLGSCTMKLNAATQMMPVSWPEFANIHPFAPKSQTVGYQKLAAELARDLAEITGFAGTSLMPNSGAQGEYTGLSVIKAYLESIGQSNRDVCLIPVSAHGTNPASATMAGLKVVPVKCLANGSLDLVDLEAKAEKFAKQLACIMITYPSTYGLFEPGVKDAIEIVHSHGGQVYLDGANMNAQVGLTSPGDLGADVCHLNLHKTFAIPHGGGGPGVGPICVRQHLLPFLPGHFAQTEEIGTSQISSVSSAPLGSASILPISYAYIKLLGGRGLPFASAFAILNANYMMYRLKDHYNIMFAGKDGNGKHCGHEFIIDLRNLKKEAGLEAIDVAKRLQDYGFHGPTMSFPVANTLMVEPTESENLGELDRFCDAMISIKAEIDAKISGESNGNILLNAPHSLDDLLQGEEVWKDRGYSREQAAFPLEHLRNAKKWPTVCRVDDRYGDLNLICTCPSMENY